MTEEELNRLAEQGDATDAWHSGCTDYACGCHFKLPKLVAEIRRLWAENESLKKTTSDREWEESARHKLWIQDQFVPPRRGE